MCVLQNIELARWLLSVAVPAVAGLIGVLLGGHLSGRRESYQRRLAFVEKQLTEFYAPMLGIRNEIYSRGDLRVRVHDAANVVWHELSEQARAIGEGAWKDLVENRRAEFHKLIEYDNKQLTEESIPAYKRMAAIFREKLWLAEPQTVAYYQQLIDFIEIWDRWLDKSIGPEILEKLNNDEEALHPFYQDLEDTTRRLREKIKSGKIE